MNMNKRHVAKYLVIANLFLVTVHLYISFDLINASSARLPVPRVVDPTPEGTGIPRNVDSSGLVIARTIDLFTNAVFEEYGIDTTRASVKRATADNYVYLEKRIRIPSNVSVNALNYNISQQVSHRDLIIYQSDEDLKTGVLKTAIGDEDRICLILSIIPDPKLKRPPVYIAFLISGLGLKYDDVTKGFVEFDEPLNFVVPKGQQYSDQIRSEAEKNQHVVLDHIPNLDADSRYKMFYFDSPLTLEEIVLEFSRKLGKHKGSDLLIAVGYEKQATLDFLKGQAPRLQKRGFRLVQLGEVAGL